MLKNKIVFITGASSGIGAACARQFAQLGANIIVCARRFEQLQSQAQKLQSEFGIQTFCLALDVSKRRAVEDQLSNLPKQWQAVDVLVNNAGLAAGLDNLVDAQIDDWEKMIDTNVKGLLYVTRFFLPQMVDRNSGHVINIGSVAGHNVYPKGAVYCATKFAVNAITQGLRMDLFGKKIRVTTVDPGAVETEFSQVRFKGDMKRAAEIYQGMTPLSPEDVADAVVYCATRAPHVNISELIIMPIAQAATGMIARDK